MNLETPFQRNKDCPLVLVEWEDSRRPVASWQYLADVDVSTVVACVSVGWLINDDKKIKALAPNIGDIEDEECAQACGIIRIPTRSITRIVQLSETN